MSKSPGGKQRCSWGQHACTQRWPWLPLQTQWAGQPCYALSRPGTFLKKKVRRGETKVDILGGVFCDSAQPTLHDVVTIQELLLCRSLHPNLGWLRVKNTALHTFGRSTRVLRWTVYAARTLCCYDLVLSVGCQEVKGSDVEAEFTGFCKFSWEKKFNHWWSLGSTSFIQSTCWRYQSRCPDWWDSLSPHCFPASWSFQTHSKPWRENEGLNTLYV